VLIQVLLDALGFAEQERRVLIGTFDEFLEDLHRVPEFLGEFGVFLVLPSVPQCGKSGLQQGHAILSFQIESFEFLRKPANFAGIHDGLWHAFAPVELIAVQNLTEQASGFQSEFLPRAIHQTRDRKISLDQTD